MPKNLNISDPVYGFIFMPYGLLTEVVAHPFFQRLRGIHQLGLSGLVYPGAQHTRFQHSLGAYHLMHEALANLQFKGAFLFETEVEAAEAAILLHDIGHGPFSHVLENVLVPGLSHEDISLAMMQQMNHELNGQLSLAIKIFTDDYPKPFLHELICSQLDTDRLDYLSRDAFFTGVREGNIGTERIIRMLNLKDNHLVVEAKGLYTIENYLLSRRLMYWQVYLHKTAIAAEQVLRAAFRRAKWLAARGVELFATPALRYFLYQEVTPERFLHDADSLHYYALLDDTDIYVALKNWTGVDDVVLATLARNFVSRNLFKVETAETEQQAAELQAYWQQEVACRLGISDDDASYLVAIKVVEKEMYSVASEGIRVMSADGSTRDVTDVSQIVNMENREVRDRKIYVFHHRG